MFSNNSAAVNQRLGYCDDLMRMTGQKERQPEQLEVDKTRLKFKRKQETLRALLVGKSVPQADRLMASQSQAIAHFNTLLEHANSEPDEAKKMTLLLELKGYLSVQYATWRADPLPERSFYLQKQKYDVESLVLDNLPKIDEANKELSQNSKMKFIFDANQASVLNAQEKQLNADYDNKRKKLFDDFIFPKNIQLRQEKKALRTELVETMLTTNGEDEKAQLQARFSEKEDALSEEFVSYKKSILGSIDTEHATAIQAIKEQKEAMVVAVRDAVIAQSTVTQDDAQKWLDEKVTITKAVSNKCKKNHITPEQLKQTLKDFFVITNGRLGKIKIDTKNHDRAYASKIQDHNQESYIMLDNRFSLGVLWHELAHHLESDDGLRLSAQKYIASRSLDGGVIHTLKELTGNRGYKSTEKAYKTDMFNHYAAKVYSSGETELFSMSVEAFYNNNTLFETLLADPVTLEFATAAIMQPKSETTVLNKNMRDLIVEHDADVDNAILESAESTFQRLAQRITWSDTGYTLADLPPGDAEFFTKAYAATPFAEITLHDGAKFLLLKAAKLKFKSYSGRAMKGVIALNLGQYDDFAKELEMKEVFSVGGFGLSDHAFPIQTQEVDRVKVMTLAMSNFGRLYGVEDTKGEIGEGYLTYGRLDKLKDKFLAGGDA